MLRSGLANEGAPGNYHRARPWRRTEPLGGVVRVRDGERATIVLSGDDTEPLLLDGDFDVRSTNPGQLAPEDAELTATASPRRSRSTAR